MSQPLVLLLHAAVSLTRPGASLTRHAAIPISHTAKLWRYPMMMHVPGLDDATLDALVRQEIESAFAGLDESLAAGDDEALEQLIREQGKVVLNNVMKNLEVDGDVLSIKLAQQIEAKMSDERVELLKKYDAQLGELQVNIKAERKSLREEMENLKALNAKLAALQDSSISRNKIVSGISLLIGLAGVGAALNEALKLALGVNGDVTTLVLNAALGFAGVLYHLRRKG